MRRDSLSAKDITTIKSSWTTLGELRELLDIASSEPFDSDSASELAPTDIDVCHTPSEAYAYISDSLHRIANNISDLGDRAPLHRHVLDPFFTMLPGQLDDLYAQTQTSYANWERKQERKRAIGRLFTLRPARSLARADADAKAESAGGETRSGYSNLDLDSGLAEDTRRQLENDRQAAWDAVQGTLQSLVHLNGELERRFRMVLLNASRTVRLQTMTIQAPLLGSRREQERSAAMKIHPSKSNLSKNSRAASGRSRRHCLEQRCWRSAAVSGCRWTPTGIKDRPQRVSAVLTTRPT